MIANPDPDQETRSWMDHVLQTPRMQASDARYVDEIADFRLAGTVSSSPLSDPAALTFAAEIN